MRTVSIVVAMLLGLVLLGTGAVPVRADSVPPIRPEQLPPATPAPGQKDHQSPAGATAECKDGAYSHAPSRDRACRHHGGIAKWLGS